MLKYYGADVQEYEDTLLTYQTKLSSDTLPAKTELKAILDGVETINDHLAFGIFNDILINTEKYKVNPALESELIQDSHEEARQRMLAKLNKRLENMKHGFCDNVHAVKLGS
jgi:hypothetical protein